MSLRVAAAPDADIEKPAPEKSQSQGQELIDFSSATTVTLGLPANTYTVAAVFPAIFPFQEDKLRWFRIVAIALLQYWASLAIETIYIVHIEDLWEAEKTRILSGQCQALKQDLLFVSLLVFMIAIMLDIRETFEIGRYIKHIPTAQGWVGTMEFEQSHGKFKFVEGNGGMSLPNKIGIYVFVLVPKALVAVFLLVFGSWWIMCSVSDTFVFLHTMSLTFVLKVDNVLYSFCNSPEHQTLMTKLPKVVLDEPNFRQRLLARWGAFGTLILVPILFYLIILSSQLKDLPECTATRP